MGTEKRDRLGIRIWTNGGYTGRVGYTCYSFTHDQIIVIDVYTLHKQQAHHAFITLYTYNTFMNLFPSFFMPTIHGQCAYYYCHSYYYNRTANSNAHPPSLLIIHIGKTSSNTPQQYKKTYEHAPQRPWCTDTPYYSHDFSIPMCTHDLFFPHFENIHIHVTLSHSVHCKNHIMKFENRNHSSHFYSSRSTILFKKKISLHLPAPHTEAEKVLSSNQEQ